MLTRTKIICTIGPSVNTLEKMLQLIDAGMNVARLNFSHGSHEEHLKVIQDLKKAREIKKVPLAIMLDTKGPEIRIGKIKNGQMSVSAKQKILLVKEPIEGDGERMPIMPSIVLDDLHEGMTVLFDDGYIISKVVEKTAKGVLIEVQNAGVIKTNKGVNVPGSTIALPAMTEQDVMDISFGCDMDIDMIAASFIRSADHVLEIKKLLVQKGKTDIIVLAKIENREGVQNFDHIVKVADGIMVARGDLGVELPLAEVPNLQKMMIRKCRHARKPVVVATQMLESMIKNPRPTRAEVSDVANAIYDSTSAIMLSGETAMGAYPIEAVNMMRAIVHETERHFNYQEFFEEDTHHAYRDVSSSVSVASVKTAYSSGAKAIFAITNSGFTARLISRCRPEMPVFALSNKVKTFHQLSLYWGVIPVPPVDAKNVQEAFSVISHFTMERGYVDYGDLVIVTAGSPFGISGTTNMMMVESIGDVIIRGVARPGKTIHGKVALILSSAPEKEQAAQDCIVVISSCDESYLNIFKHSIGIVLQNSPEDQASEKAALALAKTLDLPILVRAELALTLLKDGQTVTLDPERGIVYKGSMFSKKDLLSGEGYT